MKKALMSGIKLYQEAVLKKQHAGDTFIVELRDVIDPAEKKYSGLLTIHVDDSYYGYKGNALTVKGSKENFMNNDPRMISALMNGRVLDRVNGNGSS